MGARGEPRACRWSLIAGAFIHVTVGFIGVVFAGVWALIVYLRAEVKRRQERGLLPGSAASAH